MKHGNAEALARILEARAKLKEALVRWMGDSDAADDVLQRAYLRALEYGGTIRSDEAAIAWFWRLLRNAAIDYMRHEGAEQRARERWGRGEARASTLPDDAAETLCPCLAVVLLSLRPAYREVVEWVDFEERSTAQVAEQLGTSPNNVRVRLHRARTAFKQALLDVCGTCAEHGCLDCWCHPQVPPGSPLS